MNFGFDDTRLALRDVARDLFHRESPATRLRGLWEGKPYERDVWRRMAEVGICGLTVPEAYGGAGGNEIDLTLVYEEAGRAALPDPLLETTGVAAPLIRDLGNDDEREKWLPKIAGGEVLAAVRIPEQTHVPWAAEADLLVWWTDDARGVHFLGKENFSAAPTEPFYPTRPMARVEANLNDSSFHEAEAVDGRGSFGIAAFLNGLSMGTLEATTSYVKDRKQFGRPVGSFQAVKHKLASMHIAIETSRPAAWYAGYAIATGAPDASEAAAVAQVAAIETEKLCNREALQCHGGIGFTWEHDLHIRLKRGILLRSEFGGLDGATEALRGVTLDKLLETT
jgi:alkylation response protein AidB-like acyl-CoA dehydrogenase